MMTYDLPVYYEMKGFIQVEAESLDDAIDIAKNKLNDYPIPEGDYVEDSFELVDEDVIKENY